MASNFISYRFLSLCYAQPMNRNRFDLHHIPCNIRWIHFDSHHIARNSIRNNFDLRYMICNMRWINFDSYHIAWILTQNRFDLYHISCDMSWIHFDLYHIARNLTKNKFELHHISCNMSWINFDSHHIARHLVSNKLDLLRISYNLIRNTICPTNISRSKTGRRTGADRKRESMWGCAMGFMKQRLILPAFWWCSDRRPSRCMKRESGESPEQCPLL